MAASSKKNLHCHNSSVMAKINHCFFIPNCAYELAHYGETMPNGLRVQVYKADTGKHFRAVLLGGEPSPLPLAGILYDKQGVIIYKESLEGHADDLHALQWIAGNLLGKKLYCVNGLDS
jgi:hypothetical protein